VIELLKTYFSVEDRDDAATVRDKVLAKLSGLDSRLVPLAPPLLALLHVPVEDKDWQALDPSRRRQRTLESIKMLLLRQSQEQPLVLVFEDLHWIDSESQAVLDSLVESLPAARILLLVNYRPEYRHGWSGKGHYRQIHIRPLGPESAEELLGALLGDASGLSPLKERLIERTGGNPFFLEESVRALVETRVLTGEPGAYALAQPISAIQVPATVQAILAARIDRLPNEEKRLLQSASVVGKDVPLMLLRAVADLDEDVLQEGLAHLHAGEFLYEMTLFPEVEYTFKHALTHEVAYASLLQERRRGLHARMVEVIEQVYAERSAQHVERLALHALRGELWTKAVAYGRDAGAKALARSAHPEAVVSFEQALEALVHLPPSRENIEQAVDLRFNLRNSLWPLGELTRLLKHLREAEALAKSLGDEHRLGQLAAYMSQFFAWMGDHANAVDSGARAQVIADRLGDPALRIVANFRLGQAYYAMGEYGQGLDVLNANIEWLTGERATQRFGQTGLPSVLSRAWFIWCSIELGRFEDARLRAEEAMAIAETAAHPFDLVVASFGLGAMALRRGELAQSIAVLERGLELCHVGHVPFWFPLIGIWLGSAYALGGRMTDALPLLERAVDQHATIGLTGVHSLFLTFHGEALLLAGRIDEAKQLGDQALHMALSFHERGHQAWAMRLLADVEARRNGQSAARAETAYGETLALASGLGMRPLAARCHLALGQLRQRAGRPDAAATVATAGALLEEMGMTLWRKEAVTLPGAGPKKSAPRKGGGRAPRARRRE
jgi:tetratricopeptide (TPR) repeat protein